MKYILSRLCLTAPFCLMIFALAISTPSWSQTLYFEGDGSSTALPRDLQIASDCEPTPSFGSSDYPGREQIIESNKLARPAGKAVWAPGELVYLSGRLMDENCVPISEARVEIWHADGNGKYVWVSRAERANPYPLFVGSGRAVTDNLGRFYFITIFPGPYETRAPHIHVRATHRDFKDLSTEIFFAGDQRNVTDSKLDKLPPEKRDRLMAEISPRDLNDPAKGISAYIDLVLPGKNKWRKF